MKEKLLFNGTVKVNTAGQVFKNTYGHWKEVVIPPAAGTYRMLAMKIDGKQKHFSVGHLIADTFIPNPENKPLVYHKDGNLQNDAVDNLQWVSRSEMRRLARCPRRSWRAYIEQGKRAAGSR